MREQFTATLKSAMKAGDKRRVDTVRMITAALKDRDIEARGQGKEVSDAPARLPRCQRTFRPHRVSGHVRACGCWFL